MKDDFTMLVPEIRFKGYTSPWELRKFNDLIFKLSGGASIQPEDYINFGYRTIPKGAVNETGVANLSGSKYVSKEFFIKNISSRVSSNELVTSLRDLVPSAPNMGRIVKIIESTEEFLMPQGVYRVELYKDVDEHFLISFSNSDRYRKIISAEKNGSTQVHIRNGEFLSIAITAPIHEEQQRIGLFFRTLDESIALNQRKLNDLKRLKKAYLQLMFPQIGERVPRVRFSGFTEPWEYRKLGEVVEKLKSYPLSREVETEEVTGYRYIHYGDIHKKVADLITQDDQLPYIISGDYIPLNKGDLALADASEDYTGIAEPSVILHEPKDKIIAGLHTIAIRPQNTAPLYLYYLLHTEKFKMFGSQVGAGLKVFGINFNNLAIFETSVPTLEEQIAIGNFFHNFDKQISVQTQKLNQLKQLKSAYLQKMFI